ncbi:hypothetical protein PR048_010409 [Dryococelus australis]|uniref:Uncharacterized protein n=1 Tax=Dryococelus australis TaxID=614101 RepID=A0ABQ9I2M9_9NEOP|nr:hypothetical protein PR048_010409 [Dryococelus australis]
MVVPDGGILDSNMAAYLLATWLNPIWRTRDRNDRAGSPVSNMEAARPWRDVIQDQIHDLPAKPDRGGVEVRLLASHLGEPCSIPGFPHVGIEPDDAAGQRVFSGISRFLSPLHSGALPYSTRFALIDSKDLACRSSLHSTGATVAERLARSPPTKANRVQSPSRSPNFRKWESCRTMPLVGGFSWGFPVSPAPSFRRRSILTSITLISSQYLAVKSRPNLFIHSRAFDSLSLFHPTDHIIKHIAGDWDMSRGGYPSTTQEIPSDGWKVWQFVCQHAPDMEAGSAAAGVFATETLHHEYATRWVVPTPEVRLQTLAFGTLAKPLTSCDETRISWITRGVRSHQRSRIFARGDRTSRCYRSSGFLGDIPLRLLLHSGAAPYSPRFTFIGPQDLGEPHKTRSPTHELFVLRAARTGPMPGCTNVHPDPRSNDPSSEPEFSLIFVPLLVFFSDLGKISNQQIRRIEKKSISTSSRALNSNDATGSVSILDPISDRVLNHVGAAGHECHVALARTARVHFLVPLDRPHRPIAVFAAARPAITQRTSSAAKGREM